MYPLYYESPASVPVGELGSFVIRLGDLFKESLYVFAVRTDEDRYSAVRVTRVEQGYIQLQFRTYEKFVPKVEIAGGFHCERLFDIKVSDVAIAYEPVISRYVPKDLGRLIDDDVRQAARDVGKAIMPDLRVSDLVMQVNRGMLDAEMLNRSFIESIPIRDRRVGRWSSTIFSRYDIARFDAITLGLTAPVTAEWEVDNQVLTDPSGEIVIEGVTFTYSVNGKHLVLRPKTGRAMEFEIKVTVTDANGLVVSTFRCVRYTPECTRTKRHIPDWSTYWQSHMKDFGVVEVINPKLTGGVIR